MIILYKKDIEDLEKKSYECNKCSEIFCMIHGEDVSVLFKSELLSRHLYSHFLGHSQVKLQVLPDLEKMC